MGAFFTSVQVLAPGDQPDARDAVLTAVQQVAADAGLVPTTDEAAQRSILVGPAGRWIPVYDERTESQDETSLDELAAALSRALSTRALTVLMHDSDVLRLGLFENGAFVDRFDSYPTYFDDERPDETDGPAGHEPTDVGPWLSLVAPGGDAAALAALFAGDDLTAEAIVARMAPLIGASLDALTTGFRYALERPLEAQGIERLSFRSEAGMPEVVFGGMPGDIASSMLAQIPPEALATMPPDLLAQLRPELMAPTPTSPAGPPRFDVHTHTPHYRAATGGGVQLSASVRSAGGASRGLDVVAWGPGFESGALTLHSAQLLGRPQDLTCIDAPFARRDGVWVASFPDVAIAAGAEFNLFQMMHGGRDAVEAMTRGTLHVNAKAQVHATGEHGVHLGFVPHANPDGRHGYGLRIEAHQAARRPLRVSERASDMQLVALEKRSTLFGIIAFGAAPGDAARLVVPHLARWGAALPAEEDWSLAVYPGEQGNKVRTGRAKRERFLRSARWTKLQTELTSEALVSAELVHDDGSRRPHRRRTSGFAFGRSMLGNRSAVTDDHELASLVLWRDVSSADDAAVDADRALLVEIIDECSVAGAGIQAALGRWEWSPTSLDYIPYESVCGIEGGPVLCASWLGRWLRAVTDDWLWLGPSLRAHVDATALADVAKIVPVDDAIRLRLRPGRNLDDLEAALAPILASPDDFYRASARFYGRLA